MNYKIKIKQTTPLHVANTQLTIDEFRKSYPTIINEHNSDMFVVTYLSEGFKSDSSDVDLSNWFEVVEVPNNKFRIGQWVWHEELKQAFYISANYYTLYKSWWPNYVTIQAVNEFTEVYKRLATQEEIDYYTLYSYCDGNVLVSQYKCYYFNNVWKILCGCSDIISEYLFRSNGLRSIELIYNGAVDKTYSCTLNGLRVGCTDISHGDILKIAKHLKLIP